MRSPSKTMVLAVALAMASLPGFAAKISQAPARLRLPLADPLQPGPAAPRAPALGVLRGPQASAIPEDLGTPSPRAAVPSAAAAEEPEPELSEKVRSGKVVQELMRWRRDAKHDSYAVLRESFGGDFGDGLLHRDIERVQRRLSDAAGLDPHKVQTFIGNSLIPNAMTQRLRSDHEYYNAQRNFYESFKVAHLFSSIGALRAVQSEAELAMILAHELIHNLEGHIHHVAVSQALSGHQFEFEADAQALKLVAKAGYDPRQAMQALHSIEKGYQRLEEEYSHLKRGKGDLLQTLRQIRDIHPHPDIRRARLLEHLDEAMELYKPRPQPADPAWMRRRERTVRPSQKDRLAARSKKAIAAGGFREKLYGLEANWSHEKQKNSLLAYKPEDKAILGEAYEELALQAGTLEELQWLQTSARRNEISSARLESRLVNRHLDIIMAALPAGPTLEQFLDASSRSSEGVRRAGAFRLIGSIRGRRELDSAFKVLSRDAETLGLKRDAPRVRELVPGQLWKATRRVLGAELGRPALPEEIVAELRKNLIASWLDSYLEEFNGEILESAFGPQRNRSTKFRPSELAAQLQGLSRHDYARRAAGYRRVDGSLIWVQRHYKNLNVKQSGQSLAYNYARYYFKGLSLPSPQDSLDIAKFFWHRPYLMPEAFVRFLKGKGGQEDFLKRALHEIGSGPEALDLLHSLFASVISCGKDFKEIERILELFSGPFKECGAKYPKAYPKALASVDYRLNQALLEATIRMDSEGAQADIQAIGKISALIAQLQTPAEGPSPKALILQQAAELKAGGDMAAKPSQEERKGRDFTTFLTLLGDPSIEPSLKLMAVALLPQSYKLSSDQDESKARKASLVLSRWLLEEAVSQAGDFAALRSLTQDMLRLHRDNPILLQVHHLERGPSDKGNGERHVLRSEPFRALASRRNPFRGVDSAWAVTLAQRLDAASAWPQRTEDRLRLLDFMNSTGELSEELDRRIVACARADPEGFARWMRQDKRWLESFGAGDNAFKSLNINHVDVPIPEARALRIVRNPGLRAELFSFMAPFIDKKPARSLRERVGYAWKQGLAYRAARKHFSREFLEELLHEGSLDEKYMKVVQEAGRISAEKTRQASRRWEQGDFSLEDRPYWDVSPQDDKTERRKQRLKPASKLPRSIETLWMKLTGQELMARSRMRKAWAAAEPESRQERLEEYTDDSYGELLNAVFALYEAYLGVQDPLLDELLKNYPEPTRFRDELLEKVMKKRALSPNTLALFEGHKTHKQPSPLRVVEKDLMDMAVIQLKKFSASEKVDILLHFAHVKTLDAAAKRRFNRRILSGGRRKLARQELSLNNLWQTENYLSLLHAKDKTLLVRALFYGDNGLHQSPLEVERLFETLVIENRDLPPLIAEALRSYFRVLNEDEKTMLLSKLAALEDLSRELKGPQIVRVALKSLGVTGAKIAQVLSAHKGLLAQGYEGYAAVFAQFKDKAQDMDKAIAYEHVEERLMRFLESAVAEEPLFVKPELEAMSLKVLSSREAHSSPKMTRQHKALVAEVMGLLRSQGRRLRRVRLVGTELGSGSIKVVYELILDDGRTWVAKIRVPGASHRIRREYEILDAMIGDLNARSQISSDEARQARQLAEEVKGLVSPEMDFTQEAQKESAMRTRVERRPWTRRFWGLPRPLIARPHPLFVAEDILIEEYVPSRRFDDLPDSALLGPSKKKIARQAVAEGMFALVLEDWLEPDPHTGNRQARGGLLGALFPRLFVLDLGQGRPSDIHRLAPFMKAAVALDSSDRVQAARELLKTVDVSRQRQPGALEARLEASLEVSRRNGLGIVESLMQGLEDMEKEGALILPEYAALEKTFILLSDYSPWLAPDYLYETLQRALAARALRDGHATLAGIFKLGLERRLWGPQATRSQIEALIARF